MPPAVGRCAKQSTAVLQPSSRAAVLQVCEGIGRGRGRKRCPGVVWGTHNVTTDSSCCSFEWHGGSGHLRFGERGPVICLGPQVANSSPYVASPVWSVTDCLQTRKLSVEHGAYMSDILRDPGTCKRPQDTVRRCAGLRQGRSTNARCGVAW